MLRASAGISKDRRGKMKGRDWVLMASGAAIAAAAVSSSYELRSRSNGLSVSKEEPCDAPRTSALALQGQVALAEDRASARAADVADSSGTKRRQGRELESALRTQLGQVNVKLRDVQSEKRDLEAKIRKLENELSQRPERESDYEFDFSPSDWRELAANHQVKYRIPCPMPAGLPWKMAQSEQDELGLSSEDAEIVTQAHQRSNARVWSTLRPLCLQVVRDPDVVDLLGATSCLRLVEQKAAMSDIAATQQARRAVAEVQGGMRQRPAPGEPVHPLFDALMAVTSEAALFEADLAESFGPEEAKRVWHSMSCAASRK